MPHNNRSSPSPSSSDKIPNKPSHSGRKTSAAAATAMSATLAVPFDPSGIAFFTAVTAGTTALGGLAYHSGRKTVHLIEERVDKHRAKKALAANQAFPYSQNLALSHAPANDTLITGTGDLQTQLESCIRRLSCSVTGIVVTGTMAFVLPTFLLGVALNTTELIFQANRLHSLTKQAKAAGGVDRYLSSKDITFQVMSGILIKSAVLICTLGTDVDVAIEGFSQLLVREEVFLNPALIPGTWEQAGHISELYDSVTGHGFLQSTGQAAGAPADFVAGLLGYQQVPTLGSGASEGDVMKIGAANVLVDLVTMKTVEDPTHEVLDFASRLGRRFGRRTMKDIC